MDRKPWWYWVLGAVLVGLALWHAQWRLDNFNRTAGEAVDNTVGGGRRSAIRDTL